MVRPSVTFKINICALTLSPLATRLLRINQRYSAINHVGELGIGKVSDQIEDEHEMDRVQ